jgi:dynein assembly factor 1
VALSTLNADHNRHKSAEDVAGVLACPTLRVLDLSHNNIDDPAVVEVFAAMPALRVLVLTGNPVIKTLSNYRKTLITRCKELSAPIISLEGG